MWQPHVWCSIVTRRAVPFIRLYYLEGRCIKIPGKSRDKIKQPRFFPNVCLLCIVIDAFFIALTKNYLRTSKGTNWRAFFAVASFTVEHTETWGAVIQKMGRTEQIHSDTDATFPQEIELKLQLNEHLGLSEKW